MGKLAAISVGPKARMSKPHDAIVIDSSELTADGVLDRFEAHVRQCLEDLRGS